MSFPLQNAFQRAPALVTAEPLQRRTPRPFKRHIAARTITAITEKIFWMRPIVMTLARSRRHPPAFVPVLVAGSVRFVAGVSDAHSPTSGTAAGFSIGTTAAPLSGTHRCNSAPSDAAAENSSRSLSANTSGSAAAALDFSSFVGSLDFSEKLKDLGWGSWEVIAPGRLKSRRGSHSSPRRLSVLTPRSTQHCSRTLPKLLQYC